MLILSAHLSVADELGYRGIRGQENRDWGADHCPIHEGQEGQTCASSIGRFLMFLVNFLVMFGGKFSQSLLNHFESLFGFFGFFGRILQGFWYWAF